MDYFDQIAEAIFQGDEDLTRELASKALEADLNPERIINEGGIVGLERLGQGYDNYEVFLPELTLGGEAMNALLELIGPHLTGSGESSKVTVVIGCAQGDLHDIGLNLVATQLSVNGYNVINLGTDTSVSQFIKVAQDNDAKIIAVSSLLTTSAYYQEELIKKLEREGIRDQFKIVVGGGPITPAWTRKIGADGYSRTANQSVQVCKRLLAGEESPVIIE